MRNAELLAGLSQLVQRGNQLTAEVLAHLAELEERRLHLQLGFASLFIYCVEALGLSEGAAGRRVAAARVCRRFPEAFELVARGDLHLSALCGLAPHLNPQNASELFTVCRRKTRRQVDELIAARFPKPDVREQIRRLPVSGRVPAAVNDLGIQAPRETCDEAGAKANVGSQGHEVPTNETAEIAEDALLGVEAELAVDRAPPAAPARHREIEALSGDRFGVHFTADTELRELIERARALASHRLPKNDLPSLMRLVLASFVKHEEARRFAVGRKPRRMKADSTHANAPLSRATPPGEAPAAITSAGGKTVLVDSATSQVARVATGFERRSKRSRYVSGAVRRAVYLRDDAQCSFVAPDGRRCDARALLELDHAKPWGKLGDSEVDNIRLRCRAHNQLHARECFGARHIEAKIAVRRAATGSGGR
ncbi:MAG TPA: HNH endonuclease signature motif containing protein [Polyangiaceae bacterium]